jgi:hypothetical protein
MDAIQDEVVLSEIIPLGQKGHQQTVYLVYLH